MGLARVLMLMLHQPNLREVTYLFRGPTRLDAVGDTDAPEKGRDTARAAWVSRRLFRCRDGSVLVVDGARGP